MKKSHNGNLGRGIKITLILAIILTGSLVYLHYSLPYFHRDNVERLLSDLHSGNPYIRSEAAYFLKYAESNRINVELGLVAALSDKHPMVRLSAAGALLSRGVDDPKFIGTIIRVVVEDEDVLVRWKVVMILNNMDLSISDLTQLRVGLEDASKLVRGELIDLYLSDGSEFAQDVVVYHIKHGSKEARIFAIESIAASGEVGYVLIPKLEECWSLEGDIDVKKGLLTAIESLKQTRAGHS